MDLKSIGEVIATRKLWVTDQQGGKHVITVLLGKPEPFSDSSNFYCAYQLLGIGSEKIRYAAGVDGIQAVELALKAIGHELLASSGAKSGNLRWCEDDGSVGDPFE